jgi:hypothetical protein
MSQEDPNIFFRELMKSKPTPETRADWLANHLKLVELGEKKEGRWIDSTCVWGDYVWACRQQRVS